MAQVFEGDPTQMPNAAGKLAALHDETDVIKSNLATSSEGRGRPWGDDQYGKPFYDGSNGQAGYGTTSQDVQTGLTALVNTYGHYANVMGQGAYHFNDTETANTQGLQPNA